MRILPPRHSRESGNPAFGDLPEKKKKRDPRFRGDDEQQISVE
jgi:hypothetical protein